MKKFVLTKNSFNAFLGINNDEMNLIHGGAIAEDNGGPYYPTHAPPQEEEILHNISCMEGYKWDNILNMCVEE